MKAFSLLLGVGLLILSSCKQDPSQATEGPSKTIPELVSWEDGPRERLESWVSTVTAPDGADFIPVEDRIAVFDNDGTLWPEQPVPTQLIFALDFLKARAQQQPEWEEDPLLFAALKGDMEALGANHAAGLKKVMAVTHTGLSTEAFDQAVRNWIDTAMDARFGHLYKEGLYQPMLELLTYLRAHDFKTFIVSGGGADFMRVWSDEAYGIPPNQVIGSYNGLEFQLENGQPKIIKTGEELFFDDKAMKPVAIHRFIGKKPVFCGGNSDGDLAMMQYTSSSDHNSMCVLLHHTDDEREYAYDLKTLSGHLEEALEEAEQKDWLVVDMKKDFKKVFPF